MDHPLSTPAAIAPALPSPPLSAAGDLDMETGGAGGFNALSRSTTQMEADPLLLKSKLQSEEQINELRHRKVGKKHLGKFYTRQNEQIHALLKPIDRHIQEGEEDEEENRLAVKIAIYGSLAANCVLACLQLYAAVSSLSLSFFATCIDSVFDPAANLVLNWCHRAGQRADLRRYPSGGSRFETVGDIVYSVSMLAVSLILVAFSIQDLARGTADKELHVPAVIAVGIAFITKFGLFLYCYSIRGKSSQVRVLWEDHRNDLFINGFGIFTSAAGAKIVWWIDPTGALVISAILIIVWGNTATRLFKTLMGVAAPQEFQQLVLYNCVHWSPDFITKIDSCIVYHAGPRYIVEVDLVMDRDTPLWKAHDVSQALQDKLEELPLVERAYIHVDHEVDHKPEHRKTK